MSIIHDLYYKIAISTIMPLIPDRASLVYCLFAVPMGSKNRCRREVIIYYANANVFILEMILKICNFKKGRNKDEKVRKQFRDQVVWK